MVAHAPTGWDDDAARLDAAAWRASTPIDGVPTFHLGLLRADQGDLPPLPTPEGEERWHLAHEGVDAMVDPAGTSWVIDRDRAVGARVQLGDPLPLWEHVAPLRGLISWWAGMNGAGLVHGASMAVDGRAVLLVGKGGTGKSTTSLASPHAGWTLLGDDYAIVEPGPPARVHVLYGRAKATAQTMAMARLDPSMKTGMQVHHLPQPHPKDVLALPPIDVADASAELVAICAMQERVDGAPTEVRPLSSIEVLKSLAPSTLVQQSGRWDATWKVMASIARSVPGYGLRVGGDPVAAAEQLRDLVVR
jgi:hypothetical protein